MFNVSNKEFEQAYKIMEASFPTCELRPYNKMKALFLNQSLQCYGIKEKEVLVASIIVWEFEEFVFLENFAVDKKYRGQGLGVRFIDEIKETFAKKIILEVETPYDTLSERRIGFYERCGFHLSTFGYMQPPLNDEVNEVPLVLMSYPNSLQESEFKRMKKSIFTHVFKV